MDVVLRSGNEGPVSGLEQIRVPSSGESASDQVWRQTYVYYVLRQAGYDSTARGSQGYYC